jgi:Clp amino terminal domain, pathogenicity island component
MKTQHSASLLLVWRVAELEARHLKAPFLEPSHLLLGLCKIVDLDLPTLVAKETPGRDAVLEELLRETRRLREVFRKADFDARRFRRRFRQVMTTGSSVMAARGRLHRTDDAKDTFAEAERMACLGDGTVFPVHLLHAVLATKDPARDEALTELGIEKRRLDEAAKRGAIPRRGPAAASTSKDKTRWN